MARRIRHHARDVIQTRDQMVGFISDAEAKTQGDGSLHDVTMPFHKPSFALTFITVPKTDADDLDTVLEEHCKRRKSETGIRSWIALGFVVDDGRCLRVLNRLHC